MERRLCVVTTLLLAASMIHSGHPAYADQTLMDVTFVVAPGRTSEEARQYATESCIHFSQPNGQVEVSAQVAPPPATDMRIHNLGFLLYTPREDPYFDGSISGLRTSVTIPLGSLTGGDLCYSLHNHDSSLTEYTNAASSAHRQYAHLTMRLMP
jgi:hypothetical protein